MAVFSPIRVTRLLVALTLLMAALAVPSRAQEAKSLKGVALVIGQSAYEHIAPLPNPANDARDMLKLLTDMGFDARSASDRDARKLKRDLERFVEDAEGADVAFLYYSGHGIESGGENWLVPTDADVGSLDRAAEALVPLSAIMDELKATVPVTVVLLDACRTNPFPPGSTIRQTPSGSAEPIGDGGLVPVRGAVALSSASEAAENLGTVIGFAAEPGRPALDGPAGQNSPYAAALLRHLSAMKGVEFGAVMRMVTEEVYLATKARQRPWVNESLRRLLYFGVAADEPEGDEGLITGERRQLLLTISELPDVNRAQIEMVAVKDGVPLDSLFGVLRAMGTDKIPEDPTELGRVLDAQAERLKSLFAQQTALRNDDPEIARLTASADRAIRQGAIETGRRFLDAAVARVEETSGAVDQAEELIKQKRIADAAVYAHRADASALTFDFVSAASDFARASELVDRWDGKLARQYKLDEGNVLLLDADTQGTEDSLERAESAFRTLLTMGDADIQAMNRATILNNLGMVQLTRGETDTDVSTLEEAAATIGEAVDRATVEGDWQTWVAAKTNLGNVLHLLGERENAMERLDASVSAYRDVLAKVDRAADSRGWATAKINLGIALLSLADRRATSDHIVEAEAAFRAALRVYTRETTPLEWALAQNSLGLAQIALGKQRNDAALSGEAVITLRKALEVRTKEALPVSWATSEINLGIALSQTTLFDTGTAALEEAAGAYRGALEVFTRTRYPLDWASAQNNLGAVLQTLGQRNRDPSSLAESASAFRAARRVYKRKDFPLDWAMTQYNLGNTLQIQAVVTGDAVHYEEAIEAYRESLREYRRDVLPAQWAQAQASIGAALYWLSTDEADTASLLESIAARRAALEVLTVDNSPVEWANAQNGLGISLLNLGTREQTAQYLDDARTAFEASLTVFTRKDQPLQWAFGQNNLGDAYWNKASYGGTGKPDYERAILCFENARAAFTEAGYLSPIPLTDKKITLVREEIAAGK